MVNKVIDYPKLRTTPFYLKYEYDSLVADGSLDSIGHSYHKAICSSWVKDYVPFVKDGMIESYLSIKVRNKTYFIYELLTDKRQYFVKQYCSEYSFINDSLLDIIHEIKHT